MPHTRVSLLDGVEQRPVPWQLAVASPEGLVHADHGGLDGNGLEVHDDSLFQIYCAGKPLTALLVAVLLDEGELSLDDRLHDLIDSQIVSELGELTLRSLLSHTAGLWAHPAATFSILDPRRRTHAITHAQPARQPAHPIYAEYVSWELLRLGVRGAAGAGWATLLRSKILEPLGLESHIHPTIALGESGDPAAMRMRCNVELRANGHVPLLWEADRHNLADPSASGGVCATMSGLAVLFSHLLRVMAGADDGIVTPDTLAAFVQPVTPTVHDPILGRPARFGLGFMAPLGDNGYSTGHSADSFGHTGMGGMTFVGADVGHEIAYAVHVGGAASNDEPSEIGLAAEQRRAQLSSHILSTFSRRY